MTRFGRNRDRTRASYPSFMSTRSPVHPQNWPGLIKAFCEALIALIVPVLSMPFLRPLDHKVVHVIQHTTNQASMSVNTDTMAAEWSQRNDNHNEQVHLHNMTMSKPDTRFNAEHQQPRMPMDNKSQPEKHKREQMPQVNNTTSHINITLGGLASAPISQQLCVVNNAPNTSTTTTTATTITIMIVRNVGCTGYAMVVTCMLYAAVMFWLLKPEIHIR